MNDKKPQKKQMRKNPFLVFLILSVVSTIFLNMILSFATSPQTKEILYSDFLQMVEKDEVDEVVFAADKIKIYRSGGESIGLLL